MTTEEQNSEEASYSRGSADGQTNNVHVQLGRNLRLYGTPPQRAAFFVALAKAQASYEPIERSRTVEVKSERGSYTFDYAPLENVIGATRKALCDNSIAWTSFIAEGDSGPELHTMLTHGEGAFVHAIERLPKLDKPQAMGSALTYHRRYQYQCVTGTSPEFDDDGNEASGNQVQAMQQRRREPPPAVAQRSQQSAPAQARPAPQPAAKPAQAPAGTPPKPPENKPAEAQRAPSTPPPAAAQAAPEPSPPATAPAPAQDPGPAAGGYDPNAPMTAEQRSEITQLAIQCKLTKAAATQLVIDRFGPEKNATNMTTEDAAVFIEILKRRLKGE